MADLHVPTLLSLPDVCIAWIADVNERRARTVAGSYTVAALTMPASPVDLPPTDIVLLAAPYGVRGPYYDALAKRTSSLYVEKPFARSVAEHRDICARFPGSQISIGLQRRSMGTVSFLRRLLRERLFGPLRSVRIGHGLRGHVSPGTSHGANLAVAGGGILFDVGIHMIDAAIYATDAEAIRIEAGRMVRDGGFLQPRRAALRLRDGTVCRPRRGQRPRRHGSRRRMPLRPRRRTSSSGRR